MLLNRLHPDCGSLFLDGRLFYQMVGPDRQQAECIISSEYSRHSAMREVHTIGCILPNPETKTAICKCTSFCYQRNEVHFKDFQVGFDTNLGKLFYVCLMLISFLLLSIQIRMGRSALKSLKSYWMVVCANQIRYRILDLLP